VQHLEWAPNSYYRLRDSRLAARIIGVDAGRLTGEVFPFAKIQWINGQPSVESSNRQPEVWDLKGDAQDKTHDLIQLVTEPRP
jgi:hypothetical protein